MSSSLLQAIWEFLTQPGESIDGEKYAGWPLAGALWPVLLLDLAYLAFVLHIGPKFMAHRKPFTLQRTLIAYNLVQIISNAVFVLTALYLMTFKISERFSCMLKRPNDHTHKWHEVSMFYTYYMLKYVDYLDTVFFVLRKSYKQVTFLHVYHHLVMTVCCYMYIRYYGYGGNTQMIGLVNAVVHTIMYTYYLMSAVRPTTRKSLWWKKYITIIQLGQFVVLLVHQSGPLLYVDNCDFPKIWSILAMANCIVMIVMFGRFYCSNYMRPRHGIKSD